jgi:hypothetical protein
VKYSSAQLRRAYRTLEVGLGARDASNDSHPVLSGGRRPDPIKAATPCTTAWQSPGQSSPSQPSRAALRTFANQMHLQVVYRTEQIDSAAVSTAIGGVLPARRDPEAASGLLLPARFAHQRANPHYPVGHRHVAPCHQGIGATAGFSDPRITSSPASF